MNLAEDDGDPSRHIIPVDVYIIPTELPQGGYPPFDAGVAQTALDALQVSSYRNAIEGGVRIDGLSLLTDTGLVRVDGAPR
jgi:hypothetical protein